MQRAVLWVTVIVFQLMGCTEKDVGAEGGPCYGNGTCDPGLVCLSNLCVRPADGGTDSAPPDKALLDKPIQDQAFTSDTPLPDRAAQDKPHPDWSPLDQTIPDNSVPDLPVPDQPVSDVPVPPDQVVIDLFVPDALPPDLAKADSTPKSCSSLKFAGSSTSYVAVNNAAKLNPGVGDFTVEAWVKGGVQPDPAGGMLASKRQGENYYVFGVHSTKYKRSVFLTFNTKAGRVQFFSGDLALLNKWAHVVVQRDKGKMRFFADGKETTANKNVVSGSGDPSKYDVNNTGAFQIGKQPLGGYLKGNIAELRLTNAAVYSGTFKPEKKLKALTSTVALYHFEESTGTTLTDFSGQSNHGTIYSGTWSKDAPGCP